MPVYFFRYEGKKASKEGVFRGGMAGEFKNAMEAFRGFKKELDGQNFEEVRVVDFKKIED